MNRKQFSLLLALVVVAAVAAWMIYRGKVAGWESAEDEGSAILSFEPDKVEEVTITGTGGALNLANKNSVWTVTQRDGYPADFDRVAALIRTAWELKPTQAVEAGPSQLGRLGLDAPGKGDGSGTLAEFKDGGGKLLASLLLGKPYMKKGPDTGIEMGGVPAGRYVMAADGKNHVFLVTETLDEFNPAPDKWLDHSFIDVQKVQSIAVSGTSPETGWQIARDSVTTIWKLLEPKPGEQIDLTKMSSFAGFLSNATFSDVLPPDARPQVTGLDKPFNVAIITFDHFSYLLKIGKAMGANFPLEIRVNAGIPKERQPEAGENPADKARLDEEFQTAVKNAEAKLDREKKLEGHIFLVSRSTLDPVLRDRKLITMPYTPPAASPPPAAARPVSATPPPVTLPGRTVATPPVPAPMPAPKKNN